MLSKSFLVLALLFLTVAAARAQAPAPLQWSKWQPTTTSAGISNPNIQYAWRSVPPCTPGGCQLEVLISNANSAPVQFHYSVYTDNPGPRTAGGAYGGEPKPVAGDASLKAFSGQLWVPGLQRTYSTPPSSGDRTNTIRATGFKISHVVVEIEGSGPYAGGQYHFKKTEPGTGNTETNDTTVVVDSNRVTVSNKSADFSPRSSITLTQSLTASFSISDTSAVAPVVAPEPGLIVEPARWTVQVTCKAGMCITDSICAGGPCQQGQAATISMAFPSEAEADSFFRLYNASIN